ncbi:preprotein translocase subunit YajC [Clostridium intestinale]|jgi:preprotein translocase subunit YajC|uniref:Preprotein translocase subunit YajC n=1 Tax=Clostridium intestinale URNW TaxID=1294142 RepID=U2NN12_9CLOT|nr:preprotein translocase subunit YajC [Clostridium intestinale]ERK30251.1 preprotein translocase subunit YajC [Clostridium intestinale URNW]
MSGGQLQILILVGILVVFYGVLIIPEKKRRKTYNNMLSELKVNDRIITRGGLIGRIVIIEKDNVIIEVDPDNIRLTFSKQGISSLLTEESNM